MKLLIMGLLTIGMIVLLLIKPTRKYRNVILGLYGVAVLGLSASATWRTASLTLPFYYPSSQTFYQREFLDNGEYPDAFLPLLLKGKTVYTKDDGFCSDEKMNVDWTEDGKYWIYFFYHMRNAKSFLETAGANVIPDVKYNDIVLNDAQKAYFEDLGLSNDMYRYMFPLSDIEEEWSNGFYYYWYYSCFAGPSHVYICSQDIEDAEELLILWTDEMNEDLYIISKDYYEKEVANR